MKDGKNGAVASGIQKFVGVPTGSERASLGFAIAHHTANQQIGIVECGAVSVGDRISELTAFMNRAGRFRRNVARNSAGERELLEESAHAIESLRNVGIDLAVGALEIGVGDEARASVTRPGHVDYVEVIFFDEA